MTRRDFITLLSGAAAAWPLSVRAQQRVRRIGVLTAYVESDRQGQARVGAFREGLAKLGWTEGDNIHIDYRWPEPQLEPMQRSATELVALQPEVILTTSSPTTAILLRETRTIPLVFANLVDPVGQGFVASLSRPGGNVTGFINLDTAIAGKWIELLKEIAPQVGRVAIPYHPATAAYFESYLTPFRAAGASLGLEVRAAPTRDLGELETFIAAESLNGKAGFIPVPGTFMTAFAAEITSLTARHRMPAVYQTREFAAAGGLLAYGNDVADNYRRAAGYVDRILKGEKPGELPVQFPVQFELVINLKTAKSLGLTVSPMLLARADEVIE
jgi:putative ABC transport system substrate-binding protein